MFFDEYSPWAEGSAQVRNGLRIGHDIFFSRTADGDPFVPPDRTQRGMRRDLSLPGFGEIPEKSQATGYGGSGSILKVLQVLNSRGTLGRPHAPAARCQAVQAPCQSLSLMQAACLSLFTLPAWV